MSENKPYAVLEYVVDVLQDAIIGSKVKKTSADEFAIIDGNASIRVKQNFESNGNTGAIQIRDEKQILFSEELLETVYKIHEGADHGPDLKAALSIANIIINGLNIEAELIFHAVKDQFYALSDSYEFLKFIERDIQQMKFNMSFGDELTFEVIVLNEPNSVTIDTVIGESVAPAVKATINANVEKVRLEINKQFKKYLLDKVMDFKLTGQ
ncbi:hypothetical protein [Pedobacter hiemivivus]|uniref:Uncharacterized protein n=1 Tax=Pedobacter hiemivivus TaxID=2530454 RepID=A0A4R0MXR4_9SPHI|nr:hypothetical protein [Pedobacter hiemivivus]TCC91062.1 hypothetical protein EZ444_19355 [Pedobacter hiemivivus]